MLAAEPIQWIELDVDFCDLRFGEGACTAAFGGAIAHKCFNTTETCSARDALKLGKLTLRFIEARSNLPKAGTWFPCLESVQTSAATVNIAGADEDLAPLGKRGTIKARLSDFPYHDRMTDKYAAERVSGAAQADGIGYRPEDHGLFFRKLRARWPHYAGRSMRRCIGQISGGALETDSTQHFVMTDMTVALDGSVSIEGKDVLDLADDKRVQAPRAVNGALNADMGTSLEPVTLRPDGIGDLEYPASGFACIGSEIVAFERAGDQLKISERGVSGTSIASHAAGDSVQPTFSPRRMRVDEAIRMLLVDFARIDASFIPWADWQREINRWAPTLRLSADITKPEGVAKLIGELAILGLSIWWNDRTQRIGLRMNRPIDILQESVKRLSDRNNLLSLEIEDRDEARLTTVQFFSVMMDPTKSATDGNSYARQRYIHAADAASAEEYGDSRVKQIFCRWLNHGDDAAVAVLGRRFIQSFLRAPRRYSMEVDADDDMELTAVAAMTSRDIEDATGRPVEQMAQIISRDDKAPGHRIAFMAQVFPFRDRYAFITENARPNYAASSFEQRARGAYFCDNETRRMSDGSEPYRLV